MNRVSRRYILLLARMRNTATRVAHLNAYEVPVDLRARFSDELELTEKKTDNCRLYSRLRDSSEEKLHAACVS